MMKMKTPLLLLAFALFGAAAAAETETNAAPAPSPAAERAAAAFLEAKGTPRLLERNVEEMIQQQCAAAPEMAPYRSVLERVYREHFGFSALKADLIRYYLSKFTPAELEELTRFYSSPAGRKLIEAEVALIPVTSQLLVRQAKEMLPKLQKEMEAAQRDR